jgi:hypothetical protein
MDGLSKVPEEGGSRYPCFGCGGGGPHPWSHYQDGKHIVLCPNKDNPGILDNATKNIKRMCMNQKKRHSQNTKRKNLGTANLADFDESGQQSNREQVLQSMTGCGMSNGTSVASSVTTLSTFAPPGGAAHGCGCSCIFVVDVAVLAAGSLLKQAMPITIQSNLPHIIMKFGETLNCPNCPKIRMAVDTCAALLTGSFHFYAQIAKCFPHCVAKIFAPQDYAAIVLSRIVQKGEAAVTTELEVCFQFHLLYKTKEGNDPLIMIATGPHVSVNTILGLPFVLATGAILDFVDMVVECKYLDCLPFPIDFRRTSNHVPVMDEPDASVQVMQFNDVVHEIENLECYYDAKVQAGGSKIMTQTPAVHFGTKLAARAAVSDSGSVDSAMYPSGRIGARWVLPSSVYEDENDYPSSVLGEDSYL